MPPLSDTKIFTGLRLFFAVCFSVAVLAVITVYYPLLGTILFLAGLLFLVSRGGGRFSPLFAVPIFPLPPHPPGGGSLHHHPHRLRLRHPV